MYDYVIVLSLFVSPADEKRNRKGERVKIWIIKVYLLKCYFESNLIYKWRYYRQKIFDQLNIIVPYVDVICLVSQLYWKSMWCGLNDMWCGCAIDFGKSSTKSVILWFIWLNLYCMILSCVCKFVMKHHIMN